MATYDELVEDLKAEAEALRGEMVSANYLAGIQERSTPNGLKVNHFASAPASSARLKDWPFGENFNANRAADSAWNVGRILRQAMLARREENGRYIWFVSESNG